MKKKLSIITLSLFTLFPIHSATPSQVSVKLSGINILNYDNKNLAKKYPKVAAFTKYYNTGEGTPGFPPTPADVQEKILSALETVKIEIDLNICDLRTFKNKTFNGAQGNETLDQWFELQVGFNAATSSFYQGDEKKYKNTAPPYLHNNQKNLRFDFNANLDREKLLQKIPGWNPKTGSQLTFQALKKHFILVLTLPKTATQNVLEWDTEIIPHSVKKPLGKGKEDGLAMIAFQLKGSTNPLKLRAPKGEPLKRNTTNKKPLKTNSPIPDSSKTSGKNGIVLGTGIIGAITGIRFLKSRKKKYILSKSKPPKRDPQGEDIPKKK